ncbi:hypothetical protein CEXT_358771 [Caerostris extrusa]|uniref:Uncharacterized protein n=1 Tax=Caerostris extrusa TaxID=172846 RepID=A0AAV4SVF0_CAEEX|nr:hypothetical protein CEXT_358771 [Caerostris extrusa]
MSKCVEVKYQRPWIDGATGHRQDREAGLDWMKLNMREGSMRFEVGSDDLKAYSSKAGYCSTSNEKTHQDNNDDFGFGVDCCSDVKISCQSLLDLTKIRGVLGIGVGASRSVVSVVSLIGVKNFSESEYSSVPLSILLPGALEAW